LIEFHSRKLLIDLLALYIKLFERFLETRSTLKVVHPTDTF